MLNFDKLPFAARMPAAAYHADPCPRPSLSHSVAVVTVRDSAYHAWLRHPKLGNVPKAATPEMDRGTLVHAMVFRQSIDGFVVFDHPDWRTKAAQQKRDDAAAAGKVAVLKREWEDAFAFADAILDELERLGINPLAGVSEECVFWEEETSLGPVLCRAMMDNVQHHAGLILDLKTCKRAHPDECRRAMVGHGYDVQHAAYTSAFRHLHPELAGRERMRFLFAEELPAGSPRRAVVTVAEPDGSMRELGERRWRAACETWARCLAADEWPTYSETPVYLDAPAWALLEAL